MNVYFLGCRWLHSFNVSMASHQKQRAIAKKWCGDDFVVEDTPFFFEVKEEKGHFEICSAPWGYVPDLPSHVLNILDSLHA